MNLKFLLGICSLVMVCQNSYSQENRGYNAEEKSPIEMGSEKSCKQPKALPVYWTIEFGYSQLTPNSVVSNSKSAFLYSASSSWYFYYDIPFGTKKSQNLKWGFSIAPGFGFGYNKFSINKELVRNSNGVFEFVPITQDYQQSYFGALYLDIPIDVRYLTKPNSKHRSFGFEVGPKIGFLASSEKGFVVENNDEITTTMTHYLKNFNIIRYGVAGKVSLRKEWKSKVDDNYHGFSFHLIGNFYPSQLFERNFGPELNYYSFGLGLGFIF